MQVHETPLPPGYTPEVLFLRRWLLDLRLRVRANPQERQLLLERKVREFASAGKRPVSLGIRHGSVAGNAYLLVNACRG